MGRLPVKMHYMGVPHEEYHYSYEDYQKWWKLSILRKNVLTESIKMVKDILEICFIVPYWNESGNYNDRFRNDLLKENDGQV